jgi:hypothetical protein
MIAIQPKVPSSGRRLAPAPVQRERERPKYSAVIGKTKFITSIG